MNFDEPHDRNNCAEKGGEDMSGTKRYEGSDIVLDTAKELTRGDRNAAYGPPNQDFEKTAAMWSGYLRFKLKDGIVLQPKDVAALMIMLKLSRAEHATKLDNWVDAAGYAACGWRCETVEKDPLKTNEQWFCPVCETWPKRDERNEFGLHLNCGGALRKIEIITENAKK
jgi:hypothetical protein